MEQERFIDDGTTLPGLDGRTVGDFCQWAYSDILSNRNLAGNALSQEPKDP